MSLGSRSVLVSNALTYLFGEGYSARCRKVPDDAHFPDSVRHHDVRGINFLPCQVQVVRATNGSAEADVTVEFAVCSTCGTALYKVIGLQYMVEYQPTAVGQQAIMSGLQGSPVSLSF